MRMNLGLIKRLLLNFVLFWLITSIVVRILVYDQIAILYNNEVPFIMDFLCGIGVLAIACAAAFFFTRFRSDK